MDTEHIYIERKLYQLEAFINNYVKVKVDVKSNIYTLFFL